MSIRRFGMYVAAAIVLSGCSDCGKESGADPQAATTSETTRGDNPTPPERPGTRILDPAARMPMRIGIPRADAGAH